MFCRVVEFIPKNLAILPWLCSFLNGENRTIGSWVMLGDPFTVCVRAKCADWPIWRLTSHVMCALASHALYSMCAVRTAHYGEYHFKSFFSCFSLFRPFLICCTQMLHAENKIVQRQVICVDIEAEADNFGKLQLLVRFIVLVTLTDIAIRLNQSIEQSIKGDFCTCRANSILDF